MASVRGMTPEAILALIKRELANVKLSEDQIRDLIQTNTDIVESIVDLEDKVKAGLTGEALDNLNLELERLKSELQTQAAALDRADVTLQENSEALIENQTKMAELSGLMSEGYLNADKIKPGTILGEHIAAQTVSALNIAAGAIVSEKIATGSITADHIVYESITGDRLVARSVGADRLIAESITSNEISSGAITTKELAAGSVTAENISAAGISADLITAGSLSATRVELDGNDLATQMEFILNQLDENFNGLQVKFNDLEAYVEDRFTRPVFSAAYGMLDMPNNAFAPFMRWVNQSQESYTLNGELATLAMRVETTTTIGQQWLIRFPETFEGRVQLYKNGTLTNELVVEEGVGLSLTLDDSFNRLVWFAEVQNPHVRQWHLVFNEGGERVRWPASPYGYATPYNNTQFSSGSTDTDIDNAFRTMDADYIVRNSLTNRGTKGGSSYLVKHSTDGTSTTTEYTSEAGDATTWFPMALHATIESAARSITIQSRIRVSQPKRSDRYGFLIYKNNEYVGFHTGTGKGSLTGGSVLFTHEDFHLFKKVELLTYPGDLISVLPVTLIVGTPPVVEARFMEIDLTLFTT